MRKTKYLKLPPEEVKRQGTVVAVRFDDADGNALLNLKPAVWKGEGVMYDSVSGNILHNSGSGSLTYDGTPGESVVIAASASVPILLIRRGFIVYVR